MKITVQEMQKLLKEAGLEDAAPGVVFPWGAKIVEIDGKNMLQPMTPAEYASAVTEETGKVLSQADLVEPDCFWSSTHCISRGCRRVGGTCVSSYVEGRFYCICEH